MRHRISNPQGFSLVEILIASALAILVAVLAAQAIKSMNQKSAQQGQMNFAREELTELSKHVARVFRERLTPRSGAVPADPNPIVFKNRPTGGSCLDMIVAQRKAGEVIEWTGFHTECPSDSCVQLRQYQADGVTPIGDLDRYPKSNQLTQMTICFEDQTAGIPPQIVFEVLAVAKVGPDSVDLKQRTVLPLQEASKGIEFLPVE